MDNFKKIGVFLFLNMVFVAWSLGQANNSLLKDFLQTKERTKFKVEKLVYKTDISIGNTTIRIEPTYFGSFSENIAKYNIPSKDIDNMLHSMFGLNEDYHFAKLSKIQDDLGFQHTNYLIYYKGFILDGQMIMVHSKNGNVNSINGTFKPVDNLNISSSISEKKALDIAMEHLNVTELVDNYPIEDVILKKEYKGQVVFKFAKKVKVFSLKPLKNYYVYVDNITSEVLHKASLISDADVVCSGETFYNGVQNINCSREGVKYYLDDKPRNIATYNGEQWNGEDYPTSAIRYNNGNSNNWSSDHLKPAVQVHWNIERTYDYYIQKHNRNSYDNEHGKISNIYNPTVLDSEGMTHNAAALSGTGIMLYGRGGNTWNPVVALDVAGHEFTHLVTANSSGRGLEYYGESGALNESFSDIFGACIDRFALGEAANWYMGDGIMSEIPFLRSMSDPSTMQLPSSMRQPDTYKGNYWEFGEDDNAGVHKNSGVQNYWFYLLCEGGSGVNDNGEQYDVVPIGMDDAEKIAYRNLMIYLSHTAKHIDAYYGSLQAAIDLFGENSQQYQSVIEAWNAVGVGEFLPQICQGEVYLREPAGEFSDGSAENFYSPDRECVWYITPACASYVTLKFSKFATEQNYDFVTIYNDVDNLSANTQIAKYSGMSIPDSVTSNTGEMAIVFTSDRYLEKDGFDALYYSDGQDYCSGTVKINGASGEFSDGSGDENYCNYQDCSWLITTTEPASVLGLTFESFDLEESLGNNVKDYVAVYDGGDASAQLIGKFTGNQIPAMIRATHNKLFIHFYTDGDNNFGGFTASFSSIWTNLDDIQDKISVEVFPNPAKEEIKIKFDKAQSDVVVRIYDVSGRLVKDELFSQVVTDEIYSLDVSNLVSGMYLMKITDSSKNITINKIMINK